VTETDPACWATISLFFNFAFFTFGGMSLWFNFRIPTQSFFMSFLVSWLEVVNYKNCPSTQSGLVSTGVEPGSEQWLMFGFPKCQWFVNWNWNVLVWEIQFLKFVIRCEITRKILKSFSGPTKLLLLSLSVKCENLHIISTLSRVIMSLNPVRIHVESSTYTALCNTAV
jgi:hypothetical protein